MTNTTISILSAGAIEPGLVAAVGAYNAENAEYVQGAAQAHITWATTPAIRGRIASGDAFDIVIASDVAMDAFSQQSQARRPAAARGAALDGLRRGTDDCGGACGGRAVLSALSGECARKSAVCCAWYRIIHFIKYLIKTNAYVYFLISRDPEVDAHIQRNSSQ